MDEILEAMVHRIPPPHGSLHQPLRALIFDSHYDAYKGVIAYVRVVDGSIAAGDRLKMMAADRTLDCLEVGVFRPAPHRRGSTGRRGGGLRRHRPQGRPGDRRWATPSPSPRTPPMSRCPGYRPAKPMVFAGLYPVDGEDYAALRDALDKLQLNDASLSYEPESSMALGFGFRCGFLGLLHMEIVQERLEREYNLDLLITAPSVEYKVFTTDGT